MLALYDMFEDGIRRSGASVIAGLDPAIHPASQQDFCKEDGCAGQARA
jgi:hypothetical protein